MEKQAMAGWSRGWFSGGIGLTFLLAVLLISPGVRASAGEKIPETPQPVGREIVLILENYNLTDLQNDGLANFEKIIGSGGIGLMNVGGGSLTRTNRSSSYLSIGMGVRVSLSEQDLYVSAEAQGKFSELKISDFSEIVAQVAAGQKGNLPGKFGEMAGANHIKISYVGSLDAGGTAPPSVLMAVDSRGRIPTGYIGPDLLQNEPDFPGGFSLNSDRLVQFTLAAVDSGDITFIDFGDTAKIQAAYENREISLKQKDLLMRKALEKADVFLGSLLRELGDKNYALMVMNPVPAAVSQISGTNALTPFILYQNSLQEGLVTSQSTKRPGLVTTLDLAPTFLARMGLPQALTGFLGEPITVVPQTGGLRQIALNLGEFHRLYISRYVLHGLYIILAGFCLFITFRSLLQKGAVPAGRAGMVLPVMVTALPPVSFLVYALSAQFRGWPAGSYLNLVILGAAVAILGLAGRQTWDRTLKLSAGLSLLTFLLILGDLMLGWKNLVRTPFGFNNIFAGGRYYGINNDCMGLLLGSAVYSLFYFLDRLRVSRFLRSLIVLIALGLVVVSQTPAFGANVGGTIAALSTGIIAFLTLASSRPINRKGYFLILFAVIAAELGIAYLDHRLGGQTHAGKAVGALLGGHGFGQKFVEILVSKIRLFTVMLIVPPYNLLLAVHFWLFYQVRRKMPAAFNRLAYHFPVFGQSFGVLAAGGLVAFFLNDTGVIATSLMLSYMSIPLGVTLSSLTKPL